MKVKKKSLKNNVEMDYCNPNNGHNSDNDNIISNVQFLYCRLGNKWYVQSLCHLTITIIGKVDSFILSNLWMSKNRLRQVR